MINVKFKKTMPKQLSTPNTQNSIRQRNSKNKWKINFRMPLAKDLKFFSNMSFLYMVDNAFRINGESNKKKESTSFIKRKYSHCADINNIQKKRTLTWNSWQVPVLSEDIKSYNSA